MIKSIRILFLALPVIICSCTSGYDIQKEIDKAVKRGEKQLIIPPGRYTIDKPIKLNNIRDFRILARDSEPVTISSGMDIPLDKFNCIDSSAGIYEVSLNELRGGDEWPDAFRGYAGWPEVYINGIPMELARWPDDDYIRIDSVIDRGSVPRSGDSTGSGGSFISKGLTSLSLEPSSLSLEPSSLSLEPSSLSLYLSGYWCYKWYDEVIRVDSIDTKSGFVRMAAPHHYGIGGPSGGLFYAINRPEFLDRPGEYFYDPEKGTISLILPENTNEDIKVNIGYRDFNLISIENCQNLGIDNIEFTAHNGLAIDILDCDSVVVKGCRINGLAQSAVKITGGSYCGLDKCNLANLGAAGVILEGGNRNDLTVANHFVVNSIIRDFARHVRTYSPAVKLSGVGHVVRQNRIFRAPHNAILFSGNDHVIEANIIMNVCWDTSDAGAIYCGRDWTMGGTVISRNHISGLGKAAHHHNWAIYLDDLASGIEVTDNIIENCPSGILVGGGRYNILTGNTIDGCNRASIMYDARGLGWYRQYLDDPDNEIWERLRAVPVTEAPWKDRFPWLQDIPDDDPGIPRNVVIKDNILKNTVKPDIHPSVIEFGDVEL